MPVRRPAPGQFAFHWKAINTFRPASLMTTYFLYLFVQRLNWKILTFFQWGDEVSVRPSVPRARCLVSISRSKGFRMRNVSTFKNLTTFIFASLCSAMFSQLMETAEPWFSSFEREVRKVGSNLKNYFWHWNWLCIVTQYQLIALSWRHDIILTPNYNVEELSPG